MSSRARASIDHDEKVYCQHMEEAAKRKSSNPKHPNRSRNAIFVEIANSTVAKDLRETRLGVISAWADELVLNETIAHTSSSSARLPFKEGAGPRGHLTSTPQPPASHKQFSSSPPSPSKTENIRNKKRLEDIEAGLRQREGDLSPVRRPGSSKEPLDTPVSIAPASVPQPPSPVPTEVDSNDIEAQSRGTYSFLGLHHSPEPVASVIKDEEQPSTPKRRRTSPQSGPSGRLPLTPPESTRRPADDQHETTSCSRKGKEREGVPPAQTHNQNNVDSGGGEPQSDDSLPLFSLPGEMSRTSSVSPTPAENVLDYTDGMKARVKALSEYMNSFDVTQAAKLLQVVERQKIQYEYRDRSQKKRIEELVAERDALVAEVSRLKGTRGA